MSEDVESVRPLLRVVRGNPNDAELAAVVAVVAALSAGSGAAPDARPRSLWADRSATLRRPLHAGAGAWRASALPR